MTVVKKIFCRELLDVKIFSKEFFKFLHGHRELDFFGNIHQFSHSPLQKLSSDYASIKEISVIKYGTKKLERRVIEIQFVNHMVDFSFKIGAT